MRELLGVKKFACVQWLVAPPVWNWESCRGWTLQGISWAHNQLQAANMSRSPREEEYLRMKPEGNNNRNLGV